jgi:hypothetical protein
MAKKKICAAGNTVVPALLTLERLGFQVSTRNTSKGPKTTASRREEEYSAEDPVAVLGLIKLVELRTWQWGPSDLETENTLHKYNLDQ